MALPDRLRLATYADGTPRITFERFRSSNPDAPNHAYGLFSAWFTLSWPDLLDGNLVTARAIPDSGELSVQMPAPDGHPATLGEPMAWDGSLAAGWGARVSPENITFMIEAFKTKLLALQALAKIACRGVGARVPVRVRLNWDALGRLLPSRPSDAATILITELTTPTGAITVLDGSEAPERIAEAIIDRLGADEPHLSGSMDWDLTQPLVTRRQVILALQLSDQLGGPIDEARAIPAGVEVPSTELGWRSLDLISNLPPSRVGVIAYGVNLVAPPNPPARHQAAIAGCEFTGDEMRHTLTLRLAPGEDLKYLSEPWLIVEDSGGTREVQGAQRTQTSQRLIVNPADLGVRLAHISADPSLLDIATVHVQILSRGFDGDALSLDKANPEAALLVEDDGVPEREPRLSLQVVALSDSTSITLAERPVDHVSLSRSSVPGWGPHEVTCRNTGHDFTSIELADEAGLTSSVLGLRPDETRTWTYLANDPFRPGYRYRYRPVGGPEPWQGPFRDVFEVETGNPT